MYWPCAEQRRDVALVSGPVDFRQTFGRRQIATQIDNGFAGGGYAEKRHDQQKPDGLGVHLAPNMKTALTRFRATL